MIDNGDLAMSFNAFKTKKAKYLEEEALYEAASFAPKEFDKLTMSVVDNVMLKGIDDANVAGYKPEFIDTDKVIIMNTQGGYNVHKNSAVQYNATFGSTTGTKSSTPIIATFKTAKEALDFVKKERKPLYKKIKSEIGDDMFSMLAKNTLGTLSDVKIDLLDAQIKEIYDKLPDDEKKKLGVVKTVGTESTAPKFDFSGVDVYLSKDGSTGLTSSVGKASFKVIEMGETGRQVARLIKEIENKARETEIANSIAINPTYKENTPLPFYGTFTEDVMKKTKGSEEYLDLKTEIIFNRKDENGTPLFKIRYTFIDKNGEKKAPRNSLDVFELGDAKRERDSSLKNGSYIRLFID